MNPDVLQLIARLAMVAALVGGGFGGGWVVNGWRLGTAMANLKADHSAAVATANGAALKLQKELDAQRDATAAQLSSIATAGAKRVKALKDENEILRASVRGGSIGLRVAATCPGPASDVPTGPPGGIVGTGTGPRLTPGAESDYFALRDGIQTQRETLTACQKALAALTGQTP